MESVRQLPNIPLYCVSIVSSKEHFCREGCFWHIQHEFIAAEREILGRGDQELSSLAGYAGGTKTDKEGRVCYHNFQFMADYGKLGHGEVVGMTIPEANLVDFAKVYFDLFRRGGRYRVCLATQLACTCCVC